jgi:hypothetical protein
MPDLQAIGLEIKAGKYDDDGAKKLKRVFSQRMKLLREEAADK